MLSRRVNVNITEQFPLALCCARDARAVSSTVQEHYTLSPPSLHKLSRILHWIFHRAASVLMVVAVSFARAPFALSGGLQAIFVAALGSSRCLFFLPFPIPFGLLLIKLTLRINIQPLVNFLIHNVKNKEHQ